MVCIETIFTSPDLIPLSLLVVPQGLISSAHSSIKVCNSLEIQNVDLKL